VAFIYNKTNPYNNGKKFNNIFYSDPNLSFLFLFNSYNNFVFYKSKLNVYSEYTVKERISSLLSNDYKIHNPYAIQHKYIYPTYHIKFLNIDDIVGKLLQKKENYDSDLLNINVDFTFNFNKTMNILSYVYDTELHSGLIIKTDLDKEKLILNRDELDDLSFDDYVKAVSTNIVSKLNSIINDIFKTDFNKIENYLKYLDLQSLYEIPNGLKLHYKNFEVTQSELIRFNKTEIDFDKIAEFTTNNEEYVKFISILNSYSGSLTLKYLHFKFAIKDLNDNYYKDAFNMHLPLLVEHFTYKNISTSNSLYSNNVLSYKDDILFIKVMKLYFYLLKKNNIFHKFIDEYEKLVLT